MKRKCSWCGEYKEETEFYYDAKNKKYRTHCRKCERDYQQTYVRANKETEPKICVKCKTVKPIDDFRYMVTTNRYHSWCKCCEKEYDRIRRKRKKENNK